MYELSPYFQSLNNRSRLCPECRKRFIHVELSVHDNPDFAQGRCVCGSMRFREVPGYARLDTGARDPREGSASETLRILKIRFAARQRALAADGVQVLRFRPRW